MKLELKRLYFKDTYTIGKLYVDGDYLCDTLEDKHRSDGIKVYGETCIPEGTYRVILNYSNRFKKIMPLLLNVFGFIGIRIHSGNTDKDTLGCILVGENKFKGALINSRIAFANLMSLLEGETNITITITKNA